MHKKDESYITLTIDRTPSPIAVSEIVYAEVYDKLCHIHLSNRQQISIFISIQKLQDLLPDETFLRISRSCILSLYYVNKIIDASREIELQDGTRLTYSVRNSRSVHKAYNNFYSSRSQKYHQQLQESKDYHESYYSFDHFDHPFIVLEAARNPSGVTLDFIFRYVNEAFLQYRNAPKNTFLDQYYSDISQGDIPGWTALFYDTAYNGTKHDFIYYNPVTKHVLRFVTSQASYGVLTCLINNITRDYLRSASSSFDRIKVLILEQMILDLKNSGTGQSPEEYKLHVDEAYGTYREISRMLDHAYEDFIAKDPGKLIQLKHKLSSDDFFSTFIRKYEKQAQKKDKSSLLLDIIRTALCN